MSIDKKTTTVCRPATTSLLLLGLTSVLFSQSIFAAGQAAKPEPDVLVFANGDQLTGTLERGAGDSILFKSDTVGEVTVPLSKIKELKSHGGFVVVRNGERLNRHSKLQAGTLTYGADGITDTNAAGEAKTTATKDIGFIIDQTTFEKEIHAHPGPLQGWKGALTFGASDVQATQYGSSINATVALVRAIPTVSFLPPRTKTTFNMLETYGKLTQPTIPQTNPPTPDAVAKTSIFHADFEHDKYFSQRLYGFAGLSFDHNFSQGLNLQQIYGGGIGWTAIKDAKQELDVKADVHYERQNFQPPTVSENLIGSTFAEIYTRTLPGKLLFNESGSYIIGWNDTNAYSAIISAGLTFPVYKRFSANVNITDNFLNNPAVGYDKNSFQFVTGIGYSF